MARRKKDREVSIVHFSFFDLLFGAFGAFVFLMIVQVISTLNLIDADIQEMIDNLVQEKQGLTAALSEAAAELKKMDALEKAKAALTRERKELIGKNQQMASENRELRNAVLELQTETEESRVQMDLLRSEADLLASLEDRPLKIATNSFPEIIAGQDIAIALAATGGLPPYTWESSRDLPPGLILDGAEGILFGTVEKPGEHRFTLTVTDANGRIAEKSGIAFPVIPRQIEEKPKVSIWFFILAVISSLLLAYILWGKYKAHKFIQKMKNEGYDLKFIRER